MDNECFIAAEVETVRKESKKKVDSKSVREDRRRELVEAAYSTDARFIPLRDRRPTYISDAPTKK